MNTFGNQSRSGKIQQVPLFTFPANSQLVISRLLLSTNIKSAYTRMIVSFFTVVPDSISESIIIRFFWTQSANYIPLQAEKCETKLGNRKQAHIKPLNQLPCWTDVVRRKRTSRGGKQRAAKTKNAIRKFICARVQRH